MARRPVWKDDKTLLKAKLGNVRKGLKEHRKILSVVSAIVVLGSFVVKEVWDERLRGAQEKIRTVLDRDDRLEVNEDILFRIAEVQLSVDDVKAPVTENTDIDMDLFTKRYGDKLEAFEGEMEATLDRADSILAIVRNRTALDTERLKVKDLLGQYFRARLAPIAYGNRAQWKSEVISRFEKAKAKQQELQLKTIDLEYAAYRQAHSEVETIERRRTLSLKLSYFFFGVGWVLGLAANFLGSSGTVTE